MVFLSLQGKKNNNKTVMARMYEKLYLLQHENGGRFFCTGNFRVLLLGPKKRGGQKITSPAGKEKLRVVAADESRIALLMST